MAIDEHTNLSFGEAIDNYIEVLNDLFGIKGGIEGLHLKHPINIHLNKLQELRDIYFSSGGTIGFPSVVGDLPTQHEALTLISNSLSRVAYDYMTWLSKANYSRLVNDAVSTNYIRSRIADPNQYEGLLTELYYWGWLRNRGIQAEFINENSMPDLYLGKDRHGKHIYCEVKTLNHGTTENSIKNAISKANKQVKSVPETNSSGFVVFRISPTHQFSDLNDHMINKASSVIEKYARSNMYRSLRSFYLVWDRDSFFGQPPNNFQLNSMRCTEVWHHSSTRKNFDFVGEIAPKHLIKAHINKNSKGVAFFDNPSGEFGPFGPE